GRAGTVLDATVLDAPVAGPGPGGSGPHPDEGAAPRPGLRPALRRGRRRVLRAGRGVDRPDEAAAVLRREPARPAPGRGRPLVRPQLPPPAGQGRPARRRAAVHREPLPGELAGRTTAHAPGGPGRTLGRPWGGGGHVRPAQEGDEVMTPPTNRT